MKTIKRYPNRKLYDTEQSRYITLEEIAGFLKEGGEVHVIDSKSGEDITAVTLAQVLLGEEKRKKPSVPMQRLLTFLQSGNELLQRTIAPVTTLKDEAEKTVARLMHREPAEELRDFIMTTHKAYDEVQRRVDERLQMVLATARNLSPILKDMDHLRTEVAALERRIEELKARAGIRPEPRGDGG
jgi:polyhydroxyalkanoate synthesis repressor PhaR